MDGWCGRRRGKLSGLRRQVLKRSGYQIPRSPNVQRLTSEASTRIWPNRAASRVVQRYSMTEKVRKAKAKDVAKPYEPAPQERAAVEAYFARKKATQIGRASCRERV